VNNAETQKKTPSDATLKPQISDYLAGETKRAAIKLAPYLPQELVGGSVPYVAGTEEEAVWNAASQACGTEKVHFCYTIENNRCWYIATPSSALASNPDSWCPLSAALPGNSEYWDRETVYIYEQEGLASALRWDPETGRMQVFLGAGRTLLPRIQSMDANFVTINPDMADQVPWKNRALMTEKLSRAAAKTLLLVGIFINFLILGFFVFQFILTANVERDLRKVKDETSRASQNMMIEAYNALQSDSIKHMVRIQELLDELRTVDGTLIKYEVSGKKVTWEALVPPAYGQGVGSIRGVVQPGIEKDGRVRIKGNK
jgi:large-conductance mechanosensitive channel